VKDVWFTRRAIALHVVIIVVVPTFAALCDWQVHRALAGNDLSWAYVFEWPFFAGYAVYMWWRFIHEPPPEGATSATPAADVTPAHPIQVGTSVSETGAETDIDDDAERAAYNKYLAELAAQDKPKQWR
jgi:hypothetical protein